MQALTCSKCGAPINPRTYRCDHCGTSYERPSPVIPRIEYRVEDPHIHKICATVEIDRYADRYVPLDDLSRMATERIVNKIAQSLTPFMTFETEDDPFNMTRYVRGFIRVADENYRR